MNPNQAPQFEAPQPTARQERAINMAGRLLGAGNNADPLVTLDMLATDVGGYNHQQEGPFAEPGTIQYVHGDAKPSLVAAAQDETTKSSFKQAYKTAKEWDDNKGTNLDSAVTATVDKRRATGAKAGTLRGKLARRLVSKATKGVGVSHYTRGNN